MPGTESKEVRKTLSPTQLQIIVECAQLISAAEAQLREQRQKAQMTQRLIFEAHEIPEGTEVQVDPERGELAYKVVETPPTKPVKVR